MSIQLSMGLRNAVLEGGASGGYKGALNDGFIYIFSDPSAAGTPGPDDAVSDATYPLVAKISANDPAVDDGATGLTFQVAANGVLAKTAAEPWQALVNVVGSGGPSTTQTPTFARFVAAADVGTVRSASTTAKRLQFSVSGPAGNGDVLLTQATYEDNGTNEIAIDAFQIRLPAVG